MATQSRDRIKKRQKEMDRMKKAKEKMARRQGKKKKRDESDLPDAPEAVWPDNGTAPISPGAQKERMQPSENALA
jgi:hypothetical protein